MKCLDCDETKIGTTEECGDCELYLSYVVGIRKGRLMVEEEIIKWVKKEIEHINSFLVDDTDMDDYPPDECDEIIPAGMEDEDLYQVW